MTVTFFSNFLNHHQLPFCLCMEKLIGSNFVFVATEAFNGKVVSKGFTDINSDYSFCLTSYDSKENYDKALLLATVSDVIIWGSAPAEFLFRRLDHTNKLTFRYSERLFKPYAKKSFRANISNVYRNLKYKFKPYYLLSASAYAPIDFFKLAFDKKKMFKWGYFPAVSDKSFEELCLLKSKNKTIELLWVGRMLDLKRPEHAVYAAELLASQGINFRLTIIADGDSKSLIALITSLNLLEKVVLLPALNAAEVRSKMEATDIFMFTSDYSEGWGAVLNEAMASGTAVIASHSIGSAGFLIEHNVNGLIYCSENVEDLCEKALLLCENESLRKKLSLNAFNTIKQDWNADKAAHNLLQLSETLINRTKCEIISGPCSYAKVIPQNKMYSYLTEGK